MKAKDLIALRDTTVHMVDLLARQSRLAADEARAVAESHGYTVTYEHQREPFAVFDLREDKTKAMDGRRIELWMGPKTMAKGTWQRTFKCPVDFLEWVENGCKSGE